MSWFKRAIQHGSNSASSSAVSDNPPEWKPAPEQSRINGLYNEAPDDEYLAAEDFCRRNLLYPPRILPSNDVDRIREQGCKAWDLLEPGLKPRFKGRVRNIGSVSKSKLVEVWSDSGCGDICIMSNFPIMGGQYDIRGKQGVYFEVTVKQMNGIVAIGTVCQPYPEYRFPGWNRQSAGLHLDDMSKFFEDPDGGRPYDERLNNFQPGDVIGCGYEFSTASLFFTYNGERLEEAFRGIYVPRESYDVYAAIGVGGPGANHLIVNFGGGDGENLFLWKPAREWAWRVEGHVGRLASNVGENDELPSYSEMI